MKLKVRFLVTMLFSVALAPVALLTDSTPAHAEEAEENPKDPRAVKLLDDFMTALQTNQGDMDAAITAAKPFLHRSLLKKDGTDISADLRRFSFKKAWENAKFYASPVNITRVRPTGITAIGFKETAEAGKVVDYFIAKKDGVNGMPAPVKIFFPASGAAPRISYIGSI